MAVLIPIEGGITSSVKACGTCRHFRRHRRYIDASACLAASEYAINARGEGGGCEGGGLWEPKPAPVPLVTRLKRCFWG